MSDLTWRILHIFVRLFPRLDAPEREWLLSRLTSDHRSMLKEERAA